MAGLLPSEADTIARRLTDGRVRVEADDHDSRLVLDGTTQRIRLLHYQMIAEGIADAVRDFDGVDVATTHG